VLEYYGFVERDVASLGELFLTFCGNIVPCEFKCQAVHEEWHSNQTPGHLERRALCYFKTSGTTCLLICHNHPRTPELSNPFVSYCADLLHFRVCRIQKPVYEAVK